MTQLFKRNKINTAKTVLLYLSIVLIAVVFAFVMIAIDGEMMTVTTIFVAVFLIICLPSFIKNTKNLCKISKLLNSKPEHYIEVFENSIRVHALDKDYDISFQDVNKLNYSFDRFLIGANFLQLYSSNEYRLNVNSKKENSTYSAFDLSREFVPCLKNNKKTKHGILLITTQEYFFVLPEIADVEKDLDTFKKLISYMPKDNEKSKEVDFIIKIYQNIYSTKKENQFNYNEYKFLSLTNMMESCDFDMDKNIIYLEELGATNYANILKNAIIEIKNHEPSQGKVDGADKAIQLLNKIKILDEKEPFYKTYLIPFAKEHLSNYIK